jgi:proline iminopeptidase
MGDGPPLVCHPGGPGLSGAYFGSLPELAEGRTVLLLDPRGTGASDRPADPRGYRLEDYASDLEELRGHLGLERLDLLGHSHGGFIATTWASSYPKSVGRLVLANTVVRFGGQVGETTTAAIESRAAELWYQDALAAREYRLSGPGKFAGDRELGELFARELPFYFSDWGPEEMTFAAQVSKEGRNGDAMRFFNSEIAPTFDLRDRLGLITSPTLVITGERDFVGSPDAAGEIAEGLPDATLVVLQGSAHFSFVESKTSRRFADAVLDFLDPTSSKGG